MLIDGQDYSVDAPAAVRVNGTGNSRYFRWFSADQLSDRRTGEVRLTLMQRLQDPGAEPEFRLLLVDSAGVVTDERFRWREGAKLPTDIF